MRNLILVLGDQLDIESSALADADLEQDAVWMAEVASESEHVRSHKARIAFFLAAMRHFRNRLHKKGFTVHYRQLDDKGNEGDLAGELNAAVRKYRPERLVMSEPGEWRVKTLLDETAASLGVELEVRNDRHFFCTLEEFAVHAERRKQLRLEFFYREMRRKWDVLMEDGTPVGGEWNYDSENRGTFSKSGPSEIPEPKHSYQDDITQTVLELVESRFPQHPGDLDNFDWPVTANQATRSLNDFVEHRLASFGKYQDAMWTDEPLLYHSKLSAALNVKLLDPRDVVRSAEEAYYAGAAPLNAVEGFIRQILGWREFVRGVYWLYMPEYLERNALGAEAPLPDFYWTGDTDMHCLRQVVGQTLVHGYAHHIQRLMVTGLFALLLGVDPKQVHQWYLAVYVDAVEWVELPNSLGMSQFADGGTMATKPYVATGKYIKRMSNYCDGCRFDPAKKIGENACPFTTLYWDFLQRHRDRLEDNPRMSLQVKNLGRKSDDQLSEIRKQADLLKKRFAEQPETV